MNKPTDSDRTLAMKLVRLYMDMEREGRAGVSSVPTAQKINQAIRDHVDSETAHLREENARLRFIILSTTKPAQ